MTTHVYGSLPNDILSALSLLDEKGVNEDVTKAMTIVYTAFQWHGAHHKFLASDLYEIALQADEKCAHV